MIPDIDPSKLVSATFLGCNVGGKIAPTMKDLLARVEARLVAQHQAEAANVPFGAWHGIRSVGGYRHLAAWHGAGLAIDLNYETNGYSCVREGPTLGGEAGANKYPGLRKTFFEALDRICPGADLSWRKSGESTAAAWTRWHLASEAVKAYFAPYFDEAIHVMHGTSRPVRQGVTVPPQILADYDAIRIPLVIGNPDPKPGATRNPACGLMDIPQHVATAFREEKGVRWGAVDFGSESGDIMHFDCPALATTVPVAP